MEALNSDGYRILEAGNLAQKICKIEFLSNEISDILRPNQRVLMYFLFFNLVGSNVGPSLLDPSQQSILTFHVENQHAVPGEGVYKVSI